MSAIQNLQESLKGLSVEELLVVIAAASAEAKKAAKAAPKVKEVKEKKGSMPKGVLPKQLQKSFAWVDFVLADANKNGWESFQVKGQEEAMAASVERDGQHVFEASGKPLNRKQAMSLSKYYWSAKEAKGARKELFDTFEAQYVETATVAVTESVTESQEEEVKEMAKEEAPKKESKAAKAAEKEAEKLKKEQEKAAKAAEKEAEKLKKEQEKAAKAAEKEAEKLKKEQEKAAPKVVKKVIKKAEPKEEEEVPFVCPGEDELAVWVYRGKKVFRAYDGAMWERTSDDGCGPWMGMYDAATKTLDTTAKEPLMADE